MTIVILSLVLIFRKERAQNQAMAKSHMLTVFWHGLLNFSPNSPSLPCGGLSIFLAHDSEGRYGNHRTTPKLITK